GREGGVGRLALERIRLLANGRSHGHRKVAATRRRGANAGTTVGRQASRDRAVSRAHDGAVPKESRAASPWRRRSRARLSNGRPYRVVARACEGRGGAD